MQHSDSPEELRAELRRLDKRWHAARQPLDDALILARRLQEALVLKSLPQLPGLRCAVFHRSSRGVGGDFYDLFRLDDDRIGFFVADALAHSLPAGLLTVLVRQLVDAHRLTSPGEILRHINRELIALQLSETPLVTMVCGHIDRASGQVAVARAGQHCPIFLPKDGPPSQWQIEGPPLGMLDSTFTETTRRLQSGDQLVLCSDGIDAAPFESCSPGMDSVLAYASSERWPGIDQTLALLAQRFFTPPRDAEDVTLLGFERE